jgi:hypothetical protein
MNGALRELLKTEWEFMLVCIRAESILADMEIEEDK